MRISDWGSDVCSSDLDILRAGKIPAELVTRNEAYLPAMQGVTIARQTYTHIAGIDIVRTGEDQFYVLEDNARTPSGVRSEEHTSELQSLMRISYAVFCLKKKN